MSNPSPPRAGGADGDAPFELQYFPPESDLADLVSTFYFARIDLPLLDEYERADRPQFRLMTNPDGEYVFPGGHRFAATRAPIVGPTSDTVPASCRGPTRVSRLGHLRAASGPVRGDAADNRSHRPLADGKNS